MPIIQETVETMQAKLNEGGLSEENIAAAIAAHVGAADPHPTYQTAAETAAAITAAISQIPGGAGATDLTATINATQITINSSTGAGVVLPAATLLAAGLLSAVDKNKLEGLYIVYLSTANTPSQNTAILQSALDIGGSILVVGQGVYNINDTLIVESNTTLTISKSVQLRIAGNTNKSLITNRAYLNLVSSPIPCTITWSAGITASILDVGHGLLVGDYVVTKGISPVHFRGIFRILSVTDADNYVIALNRVPSGAPTGTASYVKADVNIHIYDLNVDANGVGNAFPIDSHEKITAKFCGVQNLNIYNPLFVGSKKYGLCLASCRDFEVHNFQGDRMNSDGIKVYGGCFHGDVFGIRGNFNDDGMTLQPYDFAPYDVYNLNDGGDIIDVIGHDIHIEKSTTSTVVIYPNTEGYIDRSGFDGVSCKDVGTVNFRVVNQQGTTAAGHLIMRNAEWMDTSLQGFYVYASAGTMTIEELDLTGFKYSNPNTSLAGAALAGIELGTQGNGVNCVIKKVTIDKLNVDLWQNTLIVLNGTINLLDITGQVNGRSLNNGTLLRQKATAVVRDINIRASEITGTQKVMSLDSAAASAPAINVIGNNINVFNGFGLLSSCKINLQGNKLTMGSEGIVRTTNNISITYATSGNDLTSGPWMSIASGTPTVLAKSMEAALDINLIGRAAGSMCIASVAAGTIVSGNLAVCDATAVANSWKQVSNTTLVF